ncbi:Uncharacterised protein [uncultured archaeon]|nr:Uncharacterised protein [uncultured archaeon]
MLIRFLRVRRVSPLLFFDGIQLSAIPELGWTTMFAALFWLAPTGFRRFIRFPRDLQPCGIIALARCGLVSVPEPELSPHILWDVCVSSGGGSFHTGRNRPAAAALPLSLEVSGQFGSL